MTDHNIAPQAKESRALTILQVLPNLEGGGVERGTIEMAAAIQAAGWNSIVVSAGGKMVYELERIGVKHITMPVQSKNPFVIRQNLGRLVKLIKAEKVDVVHARSRAPAWSAYGAARKTGAHFVTTFHAAYTRGGMLKRWYN